jgi:hypothetical protein
MSSVLQLLQGANATAVSVILLILLPSLLAAATAGGWYLGALRSRTSAQKGELEGLRGTCASRKIECGGTTARLEATIIRLEGKVDAMSFVLNGLVGAWKEFHDLKRKGVAT